jgi:hypothetical protein
VKDGCQELLAFAEEAGGIGGDYPCWARAWQERFAANENIDEASKVPVSLTGFGVRVSIDFRLRKTEWTPPQLL